MLCVAVTAVESWMKIETLSRSGWRGILECDFLFGEGRGGRRGGTRQA